MSSDKLRQAAETLRGLAERATSEPWVLNQYGDRCLRHPYDNGPDAGVILWDDSCAEATRGMADGAFIAAMHPGVGLLLADLIDTAADHFDPGGEFLPVFAEALAVADAVLGGQR